MTVQHYYMDQLAKPQHSCWFDFRIKYLCTHKNSARLLLQKFGMDVDSDISDDFNKAYVEDDDDVVKMIQTRA